MADIRPFKAVRPAKEYASRCAALPYDVYNRAEAREVALKDKLSFLNIDRPETQFPEDFDMYAPEVYEKACQMLDAEINEGIYIKDQTECYYLYELTMNGRSQTGIVAAASVDNYVDGIIKKHENTRAEKELDRINHVSTCSAQTGPIFLAYRRSEDIEKVVKKVKATEPLNDFVSEDGIGHRTWIISETADIEAVKAGFDKIPSIYIADGHHRAASAVKVSLNRRNDRSMKLLNDAGKPESDYFLSVLFPENELKILPYNRVVADLNGYSTGSFLEELKKNFDILESDSAVEPCENRTFGLYLGEKWYLLKLKASISETITDPVAGLDVSILQDLVLSPILGINDPKTDKRIDFVGGIRGVNELERRCKTDMKLAFSMYPTSITELFDVADAGKLMPPKSTWFEPKLRSGLFIHKF